MPVTTKTLQSVFDETRYLTGLDSQSLSDARLLALSNLSKDEIFTEIVDVREDFFGERAYRTLRLPSGSDNGDEYELPNDFYKMLRFQINWTDISNDSAWRTAVEVDMNNYTTAEWENLMSSQSKDEPIFDYFDNRLFVAPVAKTAADVITNGMEIWFIRRLADYTAANSVLEYPFDLYRHVLAYRNRVFVMSNIDDKAGRQLAVADYERALDNMKKEIRQGVTTPVITRLPSDYGYDY